MITQVDKAWQNYESTEQYILDNGPCYWCVTEQLEVSQISVCV